MKRICIAIFCSLSLCLGGDILNPYRFGTAAAPTDLPTGLIAYWKLDATSGNRVASSGGFTLTDINSTPGVAGKVGNCADFEVGSSQSLSSSTDANAAPVDFTDSTFEWAMWLQLESKPASIMAAMAKYSTSSQRAYRLFWEGSAGDAMDWSVSPDGVAGTACALSTSAISTGTWFFVNVWHEQGVGIGIRINNSSENLQAQTGGIHNSTAIFRVGADGASAGNFWDGKIDEIGCWSRKLTAAERTQLYNSGNGVTYPAFALIWDNDRTRWIAMNTIRDRIIHQRFTPKRDLSYAFSSN